MSTISGNGEYLFNGDGGPALAASHARPVGIAVDPVGNVFVADVDAYRVRKITPAGVITTFAGNGQPVFASDGETAVGDGGPATAAAISPRYLATDAAGNLFIADMRHHRIRKVTPGGTITTVAGVGLSGYTGDGGAATSARFLDFGGITLDKSGNLFISSGHSVRKVTPGGIVTTFAGMAIGFFGDGGPATLARMRTPMGLAFDAAGNLFIADNGNNRVRRVSPGGTISTVLGGGIYRDDVFASNVYLDRPVDVAVDSKGYVYVALEGANAIRKLSPTGIVSNAAGYFCPYQSCFGGLDSNLPYNDGGSVFQVNLAIPRGIDMDASDRLFVSDTGHNMVRRVSGPTPLSVTPDTVDVFKAPETAPIASVAIALDIGDYNGDGRVDVAVATGSMGTAEVDDYKVLLYLQQANGSFSAPVKADYYALKLTNFTHDPTLRLVDLNHDGRKDIVVSDSLGLTIFLGNVSGTLVAQPNVEVPATGQLNMSVVTDVDHDGHLDVVASGRGDGFPYAGFWLFRGTGDGSFVAPTFTVWESAGWHLALGDLNNDGNLDLVTAGQNAKASILFHNGTSGYGKEARLAWLDSQAALLAADVNDDSRADLLIGTGRVSMLLQESDGRLDGPRFVRFAEDVTDIRAADMNGDGRLDLIGWMGSWGIGYLQRSGNGYSAARNYYVPMQNPNRSGAGLAVGRIDSDNCPDLALASGLDGLTIVRGKNCVATVTASDVDGDGKSDLAWVSDGKLQLWPAAERAKSLDLRTAPGWQLAAVADISGDGRSDLIWRNCVNDLVSTWDGARPTTAPGNPGPDKAWRLVATADFDGNGRDDFLWQHASGATRVWPDGSSRRERKGAALAPGWTVVATGRFDGDAKYDVFWRHGPTGANLIWRSGGAGGALRTRAVLDKNWQVVGSGDVDNDGRSDLLWRNRLTGANVLWRSADPSQQSPLPSMPDPSWTVAAVADIDGDHRADVLWHHAGTGVNLLWPRADASLARPAESAPAGALPWKPAESICARPKRPSLRSLR